MTILLKQHLLTAEGLEKLTREYKQLSTVGREEVADRLHNAFEDGQDDDFVENAELEAARNELAFLEARIIELEDILGNYELIKADNGPHDEIHVGDTVTVVEVGTSEKERYQLVGAAEANPAEGKISNESPLGQALLGSTKGSKVTVKAPRGDIIFKVVKIG